MDCSFTVSKFLCSTKLLGNYENEKWRNISKSLDAKVMQIFICHKFAKTFSRTIYPFFTTVYYFPSLSKRYMQRPYKIRILWAKLLLCSAVVLPFSLTFSLLPVAQTTLLNTGWYVLQFVVYSCIAIVHATQYYWDGLAKESSRRVRSSKQPVSIDKYELTKTTTKNNLCI